LQKVWKKYNTLLHYDSKDLKLSVKNSLNYVQLEKSSSFNGFTCRNYKVTVSFQLVLSPALINININIIKITTRN
jgi:hypothetical protein